MAPAAGEAPAAGPGDRLALVSMVPLGRMAEPDEVARIVTMLCAESAGYLTGVVPVDGGLATGC